MITTDERYELIEARNKAESVALRYGGGKLPRHITDTFSLAHWYGFSVKYMKAKLSDDGPVFIISKRNNGNMTLHYNHYSSDKIDMYLMYAIGLEELGYLKFEEKVKEYMWGGINDPLERAAAIEFANRLKDYCNVKEGEKVCMKKHY